MEDSFRRAGRRRAYVACVCMILWWARVLYDPQLGSTRLAYIACVAVLSFYNDWQLFRKRLGFRRFCGRTRVMTLGLLMMWYPLESWQKKNQTENLQEKRTQVLQVVTTVGGGIVVLCYLATPGSRRAYDQTCTDKARIAAAIDE